MAVRSLVMVLNKIQQTSEKQQNSKKHGTYVNLNFHALFLFTMYAADESSAIQDFASLNDFLF